MRNSLSANPAPPQVEPIPVRVCQAPAGPSISKTERQRPPQTTPSTRVKSCPPPVTTNVKAALAVRETPHASRKASFLNQQT